MFDLLTDVSMAALDIVAGADNPLRTISDSVPFQDWDIVSKDGSTLISSYPLRHISVWPREF